MFILRTSISSTSSPSSDIKSEQSIASNSKNWPYKPYYLQTYRFPIEKLGNPFGAEMLHQCGLCNNATCLAVQWLWLPRESHERRVDCIG
jgi:hypothetical protein